MPSAKLYRQYAADCRRLAQSMPEHRDKLREIAEAWEMLAENAEKDEAADDEEPAQVPM
jgi:curved DNA-binding protein CbpA